MNRWIAPAAIAALLTCPAGGTTAGVASAPASPPLLLASAAPPDSQPAPEPFIGNKGSRKIHRSDCVWGKKISPGKRKYFKTYQEAIAEGYVPCGTCKPEFAAGLPEPTHPPIRDADIIASTLKGFFHRGSCEWAHKISAEHLMKFKTREEAIAAGKTPCPICKP
ncbi:MAG: hypothetical protein WCP22_13405 [Chlamydiota bacterium]